MLKKIFSVILLFLSSCAFANAQCSIVQTCFTPQQNCIDFLVNQINQAKKNIYVQAYTFTSYDLADALIAAKQRGVDVNIIVDKSQLDKKFHSSTKVNQLFKNANIPIWVDSINGLAHNKIMIIDEQKIETGSFNFTYTAEKYNAENMLIISNENLAKEFLNNWQERKKQSQAVK